MAFESQNKLVSSFNTDNVKQGLFRYKGNTSISNIKNVSEKFVDLVSPELNAGSFYKQANELLEVAVKGATQIKTVQNEEDELKQSIDASRELSTAYQTMQIKKEEALTAVDKQRVIDEFRDDVYAWTTQLTDRNKNSIESATHNFLNFEAREQARLVRKENVTELQNTMNNTSSFLLSSKPEDRNATLNAMRESYNKLGFTNEEFNEVAFSSLSNNLFAGITKDNISREALYTIENTAKSFLNDFKELEGSKAYNDTLKTVEAFRGALIDRDTSYVNRAIQLGDFSTFKQYNEALYRNGDITDVEYNQNNLAFNNNIARQARTPEKMYEDLRNTLGSELDNIPVDVLKGSGVPKEVSDAIEYQRVNETTNLLVQEVVDVKKVNEAYRRDPKLVDKAFAEVTSKSLMSVNSSIGALKDIKDLNSKEAQEHFARISIITDKFKKLTNSTDFVVLTSTADKNNKDIMSMIDTHSIINNPKLSFEDRRNLLYKKVNSFSEAKPVDVKLFKKVKGEIFETIKEEFGTTYANKVEKGLDDYITVDIDKGIEPSVTIDNAKNLYQANKFQKDFIVDDVVANNIGVRAKNDKDLVPSFFESDKYDELMYNELENRLRPTLDSGKVSVEEYTTKQQKMASELQRNLATFKDDYKKMRASGDKLTMYYDEDLRSLAITDNKSEPLRIPISDYTLFDKHFTTYVNKRNENVVRDKIERGVYVPFEVLPTE